MEKTGKHYEFITIFKEGPELEESKKAFQEILKRHNAEVLKEEEIGQRRLYFEIHHNNNGYFLYSKCSIDPLKVKDISHELNIQSGVLHYMVKRVA